MGGGERDRDRDRETQREGVLLEVLSLIPSRKQVRRVWPRWVDVSDLAPG